MIFWRGGEERGGEERGGGGRGEDEGEKMRGEAGTGIFIIRAVVEVAFLIVFV